MREGGVTRKIVVSAFGLFAILGAAWAARSSSVNWPIIVGFASIFGAAILWWLRPKALPAELPELSPPDPVEEVPVCLKCFATYSPLLHYCPNCGEAVGSLTPYIPFVNIRFNYAIFGTMWKDVWVHQGTPAWRRVFYMLLILFTVPIMLLGLPFVLIAKLRPPPPEGHCQHCGYNLTGNVSGVCPECGEEAESET